MLGVPVNIVRFRVAAQRPLRTGHLRFSLMVCFFLGLCTQLYCVTALASDALDRSITLDIAANTQLDDALIEWGVKAGFALMINTPTIAHQTTHGVHGTLPARDALAALLKDSGLSYTVEGGRIQIVPVKSLIRPGQRLEKVEPPTSTSGPDNSTVGPQDISDDRTNSERGPSASEQVIDEVVVTASKREEKLIDAPLSVSALSAEDLTKLGATQFRDFADTVPGLSYTTSGAGATQTSLRGVTVGFDSSPTTGIYLDEVPIGSSTPFALGAQLGLDTALFGLDRIEVLRGPQGTLYGASTMGGLIKYVTKRPDTGNFTGEARAGTSYTQDGGVSYNVAASINLPIATDIAALRASAYESHDGGYIDNIALGEKDVNRSDVYGGRLDLLLAPTNSSNIRLGAFAQDISRAGEGTADYTRAGQPVYGDLEQYRRLAEPFDQSFRLISGTLSYDFGQATLTSISSYQTVRTAFFWDLSAVYVPLLNSLSLGPYSAVGDQGVSETHKFTEEIRFASNKGTHVDWLIGAFYTREASELDEIFVLRDPTGQPLPNDLFTYVTPSNYKEYAGFGDLTWHLSPRLDVTAGLRFARNDQINEQHGSGLLVGNRPITQSNGHVFTYLGNARYHFDDHSIGYLRYATGYRPGGPNLATIDPSTGLPVGQAAFEPDRLKSYEAGLKKETTDQRYSIDLSLYYIDWNNIQLATIRGGFQAYVNAPGGAKIKGTELGATGHLIDGLTVRSVLTYDDARLAQADTDLGAARGERLPTTPHFSGSLSVDYSLPVTSLQPTVGATLRHVSDRTASFNNSTGYPQYLLPAYTTTDLRAGLTLGQFSTQLYIHNLFDNRGQQSLYQPQFGPRVAILQPRTIGITVTTKF